MFKTFLDILSVFVKFLFIPFCIAAGFLILIFVIYFFDYCFYRFIKKKKPKKGEHYAVKKRSIFLKLFYDFPKRVALDTLNRDPEFFRYKGCIIYTGMQGSGKTSALIHDTMLMQKEYPKAKVLSNLGYKYADEELDHWRKLVDYVNPNGDECGIICQMDETQNWFNSKQSKDFPPEMISVVTQNRKCKRILLGTAQNFYMLAKDIRTQCTEIRACTTILGCLTIVHRICPICDTDGQVQKLKHLGWYFFVQDEKLRDAYDTYHVIKSLSKSGFYQRNVKDETSIVLLNAK